jgi:hypothetical protein
MFGKLVESRRKSYREALISREVDTFPEREWIVHRVEQALEPAEFRI